MTETPPPAVGIDLGTTNSTIAALSGDPLVPEILPVDGQPLCPSVVSWESADGAPLVGTPARNRLGLAPEATVREAKRHMGSAHTFAVHGRSLTPPMVQAEVLKRLASAGEEALGHEVQRAVITVPAFFDQQQREATREAGTLAGLDVIRLVNEPTAATLAYHPGGGVRQVLVYDLGGGTFDASLVRMDGELIEVLASHGDTSLGGKDFDEALAVYALQAFLDAETGDSVQERALLEAAVRGDIASWTRLLLAAESAKHELSEKAETTVQVEFLVEHPAGTPRHLSVPVSQPEFNQLIADHLERTLGSVRQVLSDANATAADLDDVLLVGGSTRIPLVFDLLLGELGIEPDRSLNPDACVALGAAVQAGIVDDREVGKVLVDVAPFSLGFSAMDPLLGTMVCEIITPRNTPLPSRHAKRFVAGHEKQQRVQGFVFQGSSEEPRRNRCIGKVELKEIKRRVGERVASINVEFHYTLDGIVNVAILNPGSGRAVDATLQVEGFGTRDMMREYLDDCRQQYSMPGPEGDDFRWPGQEDQVDVDPWAYPPDDLEDAPEPATADSETEDLDDDRATLQRIMGRFPDLAKKHADQEAALQEKIDAARTALRADPPDAVAVRNSMDDLTDLLFDLGEFF